MDIGEIVHHYRIIEKLGEGGLGVVYKAEDTKLKRTVELRFLPAELIRDPQAKQRFIHDVQSASTLQHNNISTIHEIDETDEGQLFIVTDRYEGESLKDKITRGSMSMTEVLDIAIQMCIAMTKAHAKDIVHGRLEPSAIFITTDGTVKLLNFGFVSLSTKQAPYISPYIPPEHVESGVPDKQADIWAFGVILYEMITDRLPFKSDNEQTLRYSIVNMEPNFDHIHGGLVPLLAKCLAKLPSIRFQAFDEPRRILKEYRHDHYSLSSRAIKAWRSRFKWFSPVASVLVIAAFSLLVIAAFYLLLFPIMNSSSSVFRDTTNSSLSDSISFPSKSIAVLPFENMSVDSNNAYFASGIRELILTKLAGIEGLRVIARTTTDQYASHPADLRSVAQQLGVATVLEGSVQKVGNQVLINVQLIDAQNSVHLWGRSYTRTLDNLFGVEGEVTDSIAHSLNAKLSPQELATLRQVPTKNPEAYDLYLRANYYWWNYWVHFKSPIMDQALDLYQQAIDLDPEFALAYARMAQLLSISFNYKLAIPLAEKALALNPNLPEAHLAMGYIYLRGKLDYKRAMDQFIQANNLMPNNPDVILALGEIYMVLGMWQKAYEKMEQATKLDPRNNIYWRSLGYLDAKLRRYSKAKHSFYRALELNPGDEETKLSYLPQTFRLTGQLDSARLLIAGSIDSTKLKPPVDYTIQYSRLGRIAMSKRNFQEARKYFGLIQPSLIYFPYIKGHIRDPDINIIRLDLIVGQHDQARVLAQNLRDSLTYYYKLLNRDNFVYRIGYHVIMSWLNAGLGDKKSAIKAAKQAVSIASVNKELEPDFQEALAEIYTQTGQKDDALSLIQQLLNNPGAGFALSRELLRHDPVWDPLRKDPRFIALLNGRATE